MVTKIVDLAKLLRCVLSLGVMYYIYISNQTIYICMSLQSWKGNAWLFELVLVGFKFPRPWLIWMSIDPMRGTRLRCSLLIGHSLIYGIGNVRMKPFRIKWPGLRNIWYIKSTNRGGHQWGHDLWLPGELNTHSPRGRRHSSLSTAHHARTYNSNISITINGYRHPLRALAVYINWSTSPRCD